jgi:hypothetical protein
MVPVLAVNWRFAVRATLPAVVLLKELDILAAATWAFNAIRPAPRYLAVSRRQLLRGNRACRVGVHAKVWRFDIAAQLFESGQSALFAFG